MPCTSIVTKPRNRAAADQRGVRPPLIAVMRPTKATGDVFCAMNRRRVTRRGPAWHRLVAITAAAAAVAYCWMRW